MGWAQPLLPGDPDRVVVEWDFQAGEALGWQPLHHLAPFQVADGVLRTRATGDDAYMGVPVQGVLAEEVSHVVVRMRSNQPGTTQIYFSTSEHPDPARNAVPGFGVPGDNEFHVFEVALAGQVGWSGQLGFFRLDPVNGSGISAEVEIDYVRLLRKAPRLQLLRFGPDRAWARPGQAVTLTLVAQDSTHGPQIPGLVARLDGVETPDLEFDSQGATYTVHFRVPVSIPLSAHTVRLERAGRPLLIAQTHVLALDPRELPRPSGRVRAQRAGPGAVVENGTVSLTLIQGTSGIGAGVLRARDRGGQWRIAGVCQPLALLVTSHDGCEEWAAPTFRLAGGKPARSAGGRGASLELIHVPEGTPVSRSGKVSLALTVAPSGPTLGVASRLRAQEDLWVLRFGGPTLRAGAGSFGADKQAALFPGLEFLEGPQRSSDTEVVGDPVGYRPTPPPYQITVPLLAVEGGGVLCGRLWDALQRWDGVNRLPMAEFASPNFLDGQPNHLLATFVPTAPDWTVPQTRAAQRPYELAAGKELALEEYLFAVAGGRITDAVPLWYRTFGQPEPPRLAKPLEETFNDLMEGWATTCYDPASDRFVNHWRFGQEPFASPSLKAALLTHYLETGDDRWIQRCHLDPKTQYTELLGSLFEGLGKGQPPAALATQRPDGSWPYECPPEQAQRCADFTGGRHRDLGQPGSTSVGLIAVHAVGLLSEALSTGDARCEAAGLRALEAMTRFRVPAGAQTWEVHKDIPDVYAAGLAVDCFRLGYELTGEKRWLKEAFYWAYTGLPFLYAYPVPGTGPGATVNIPGDPRTEGPDPLEGSHPSSVVFQNPDRQITPYASIPVFGTSFYVVPWFGNVVQWCGLCWAGSVLELLKHQEDPVLRKAAEGVVYSGCQQTFDRPPVVGLLPDTWHLGDNRIHPAFIGPVRVEWPLRKLLDRPSFSEHQVQVLHAGRERWHILSRGLLERIHWTPDRLTWVERYPAQRTCETAIFRLRPPAAVRAEGREIPRIDELEKAPEGWRYLPAAGRLELRLHHRKERVQVALFFP